jgi:hypothetical protein
MQDYHPFTLTGDRQANLTSPFSLRGVSMIRVQVIWEKEDEQEKAKGIMSAVQSIIKGKQEQLQIKKFNFYANALIDRSVMPPAHKLNIDIDPEY